MSRCCRSIGKCFRFHELLPLFTDTRQQPHVPSASVFAGVLALFACNRTSPNSPEKDLRHFPSRLRGLVGPRPPSIDTIGRVYSPADSGGLRRPGRRRRPEDGRRRWPRVLQESQALL